MKNALHTMLHDVRARPFGYIAQVAVLSLAFLSLVMLLSVVANVRNAVTQVKKNAVGIVFLTSETAEIAKEFEHKVKALNGVTKLQLLSPEQAAERVSAAFAKNSAMVSNDLGQMMPWVLFVYADDADVAQSKILFERIQAIGGVEEIVMPDQEVQNVRALAILLYAFFAFVTCLVALLAVLMIHVGVRALMERRRQELEVMTLVGATRMFVLKPFLIMGASLGLLSSLIGLGVFIAIQHNFAEVVQEAIASQLFAFQIQPVHPVLFAGVVAFAALVGAVAALWSSWWIVREHV